MHLPVLVVEPCSDRWAFIRGQLAARGYSAVSVRSGREAAAVLDVGHVSVLVVAAVGSSADHHDILMRLQVDPLLRVVLVTHAFSPQVLAAYAVFGSRVVMAQTDPAAAVAGIVPPDAPNRAA